jgi:hypothetical protein
MKNAIKSFIALVSLLVVVWFFVSWFEVVAKSLTDAPTYSKTNFFIVTMGDSNK